MRGGVDIKSSPRFEKLSTAEVYKMKELEIIRGCYTYS